jgi:hypothetical protein
MNSLLLNKIYYHLSRQHQAPRLNTAEIEERVFTPCAMLSCFGHSLPRFMLCRLGYQGHTSITVTTDPRASMPVKGAPSCAPAAGIHGLTLAGRQGRRAVHFILASAKEPGTS